MMLLDTGFLIDLQRERTRNRNGTALRFLSENRDDQFAISVVTVLEFLEGFSNTSEGWRIAGLFRCLHVDTGVAEKGSRLRRELRSAGQMIGDFDILIAATALHFQIPLVTRDVRHFRRIRNLRFKEYRVV